MLGFKPMTDESNSFIDIYFATLKIKKLNT